MTFCNKPKTTQPPCDVHGGCVVNLIFPSLNNDFTSVVDVDAARGWLGAQATTVERVPGVSLGVLPEVAKLTDAGGHAAEIKVEGAGSRG